MRKAFIEWALVGKILIVIGSFLVGDFATDGAMSKAVGFVDDNGSAVVELKVNTATKEVELTPKYFPEGE